MANISNSIDGLRVGQAYLFTRGDITRTSLLTGVDPYFVEQLAREHEWHKQLTWVTKHAPGDGDEETQKLNRQTNYLQAVRLRELVERVVGHLSESDSSVLEGFLSVLNKQGQPVPSMKPLADLATAAETVQSMTYVALGDQQAVKAAGTSESKITDIALSVSRALDRFAGHHAISPSRSPIPVYAEVLNAD